MSTDQKWVAGVGLNSKAAHERGFVILGILDVIRHDRLTRLGHGPANRLAEFQPLNFAGGFCVDAGARMQSQGIALFVHHEIEISVQDEQLISQHYLEAHAFALLDD